MTADTTAGATGPGPHLIEAAARAEEPGTEPPHPDILAAYHHLVDARDAFETARDHELPETPELGDDYLDSLASFDACCVSHHLTRADALALTSATTRIPSPVPAPAPEPED